MKTLYFLPFYSFYFALLIFVLENVEKSSSRGILDRAVGLQYTQLFSFFSPKQYHLKAGAFHVTD